MSHPKVRYLCPLCGATLRVSGGGLNRGLLALVVGSIGISILIVVIAVVTSGN